jgi:predicted nucleic acid-binding protein
MGILMRVYYDNVIASGLITGDVAPEAEMAALREIERADAAGTLKRVTSRESWREQERTRDAARRSQLEAARDLVSVVQADHRVVGFENVAGPFGTIAANPIVSDVVDEALFNDLKTLGLRAPDARHLMYAAANDCDRFVTLDGHFLDRRSLLEARCPSIRVVRPSELAAELRRAAHAGAN